MRVGIQLPIQSHSRVYVADWELDAGPEDLVRVARAADDAGFFYVGVCDHVAVPAELASTMGTFWADTLATLGMIAGVTSQVRLLSHVYVPAYRHPLVAAKAFATLDWLSGGRVIVGLGANFLVRWGSADEIAASIRELTAIGVTNVQLKFLADPCDDLVDQIARFGSEVSPLLRSLAR